MSDVTVRSRLSSWAYALRTTNPPPDGPVDFVTRWIVVTRAAVLPMTLFAGLVAALLAIGRIRLALACSRDRGNPVGAHRQ
jgi:1,4-dihydroxy-2-naphthoate octaprenyltransferase